MEIKKVLNVFSVLNIKLLYYCTVPGTPVVYSCTGWRLECNNFASSLMSQNQTHWNLDFCFSLGTFFEESIIQLFIISNEHKSDRHFFEQKYECSGMDVSITSSNTNPMRATTCAYQHFLQSEFLRKVSVRRPFSWYCFYTDKSATFNDQRGPPPPLLSSSVHFYLSF